MNFYTLDQGVKIPKFFKFSSLRQCWKLFVVFRGNSVLNAEGNNSLLNIYDTTEYEIIFVLFQFLK